MLQFCDLEKDIDCILGSYRPFQTLTTSGKMSSRIKKIALLSFMVLLAFGLILGTTGCSGVEIGEGYTNPMVDKKARDEQTESIFGDGGLMFGGKSAQSGDNGGGIGVNGFLWRASLDTVSFMPLQSADPFGGVIITDWYAPQTQGEAAEQERAKLTVYILGRELRSDGIKVSAFRQVMKNGAWMDQPVDEAVARRIEEAILLRARELRIAAGD